MKPNSKWVLMFAGLTLTGVLVVLGYATVHLHPISHIEYLALMVNCGAGFDAHGAWTEQQHVRQYSVCLDRSEPGDTVRSGGDCSGGDCGRESAQRKEEAYSDPDDLHRRRL